MLENQHSFHNKRGLGFKKRSNKKRSKSPIEQPLKGISVSLIVIFAINEVIILRIAHIGMELMC